MSGILSKFAPFESWDSRNLKVSGTFWRLCVLSICWILAPSQMENWLIEIVSQSFGCQFCSIDNVLCITEISGVQFSWKYWSSQRFAQLITSRFSLVETVYFHCLGMNTQIWLFQLLIGSWKGCHERPLLWIQHSMNNSVRPCGFPLGWISVWGPHWASFSSGFSPPLFLQFFQRGNLLSQSFWLWYGNPICLVVNTFFFLLGS